MTPEEAYKEMMKLKELLWFRHGCEFHCLYGDDGEMQCGHCLIDFKRMTATEIEQAFLNMSLHKPVVEIKLDGNTPA